MKFVFFSLLLVSACAPMTWSKWRSDATPLTQAEANCEFERTKATNYNVRSGLLNSYGAAEVYNSCMRKEGWQQSTVEQENLRQIGMQNLDAYDASPVKP